MATPISGEQFVRTLRHYLEVNEHRLLSTPNVSQPTTIPEEPATTTTTTTNEGGGGFLKAVGSLWSNNNNNTSSEGSSLRSNTVESSSNSRPNSIYGIPIPYMSLLSATSPNATALSNTPYMPPRSSLTLDIHYLYFLLVQFEYLGLEDSHLPVPEKDGLVETETTSNEPTNKAPSITSVGSVMSTLSLSTGWNIWSSQQKTHRPLHEDIVYIHKYLGRVNALKLNMNLLTDAQKGITRSGIRTIRGYESPLPQDGSIVLPLSTFKNLEFLELSNISPKCIETPFPQLTSLVVKSGNVDNAADVIFEPWTHLKMLSFADNSLTTLDTEPAQHIRTITHLNLSSNLLIDIPAALSSLYNLSSLNLAHNMISFTTGINTVLGNIQELDLRGNRLKVLAGLDRLWALERLDIRDNRIEDVAEIGRLTNLPNIHDIWVEGNPFTKLQPDYRVELFSVFKKSDLDIELDGMKPSFNERRRIQVPQHQQAPTNISAKIATNLIPATPPPVPSEEPAAATVVDTKGKKKLARAKTRGNKRQIRLGHIEEDKPIPSAAIQDEEDDKKHVHRLAELEEAVQQEAIKSRKAASIRSRRSHKSKETEDQSPPPMPSNDKFRKKIEAMRREAGTEWLRVLQEMDVVKKESN